MDPFPDLDTGLRLIEDHRRKQTAGSPPAVVIVLTGHTPRPLIEKARRVGADYIVAKPFSANTLLDRILWSTSSVFANVACGELGDDDRADTPLRASIQSATAALLQ